MTKSYGPVENDSGDYYILLKASDALKIKSFMESCYVDVLLEKPHYQEELERLILAVTLKGREKLND